MTRWYLDTEFLEDGVTIDLISIALVSEDGRTEYYAGNGECNMALVMQDEWLSKHVLPHLSDFSMSSDQAFWKPRAQIALEVLELFGSGRGLPAWVPPEIWADHASYDWVAFCQLFGRMIDLPTGMPMFCMDLMQDLKQRGIKRSELPKQDPATEHSALEDARWLRRAHCFAQGLNW